MHIFPRVITEEEKRWGYTLPAGYPNRIISLPETGWSWPDPPPCSPTAEHVKEDDSVSYLNKDIMTFDRARAIDKLEAKARP